MATTERHSSFAQPIQRKRLLCIRSLSGTELSTAANPSDGREDACPSLTFACFLLAACCLLLGCETAESPAPAELPANEELSELQPDSPELDTEPAADQQPDGNELEEDVPRDSSPDTEPDDTTALDAPPADLPADTETDLESDGHDSDGGCVPFDLEDFTDVAPELPADGSDDADELDSDAPELDETEDDDGDDEELTPDLEEELIEDTAIDEESDSPLLPYELCNGLDDDGDGLIDEDFDGDLDGWTKCAGDCDDTNPFQNPDQDELLCNGLDDDCSALSPDDLDQDRDGVSFCQGDCDDEEGSVGLCQSPSQCIEGQCVLPCPSDMVWAGSFCIDRYEASRTDASADAAGVDESQACSRPNVMPWVVDTMTDEVFATYQAACSAAGKRLCTAEEWLGACQGPASTVYVFGDTWDAEKCNCVDSFCDDYCAANGIVSCNTSQNCGYQYSCYHPVPSGQFPDCSNAYGHFDMGGNVWEIVSSTSSSTGYEIRGGAFNCGQPSQRLQCSFVANWTHLFAGFRCCL